MNTIVSNSNKIPKGHYVYWIRNESHEDPHTEGYVGVSITPNKRLSVHKHNNPHFFTDNAQMEIIHVCEDAESAYELEKEYRPEVNIGWNLMRGGGAPIPRETGLDSERQYFSYNGKIIHRSLYERLVGKSEGEKIVSEKVNK